MWKEESVEYGLVKKRATVQSETKVPSIGKGNGGKRGGKNNRRPEKLRGAKDQHRDRSIEIVRKIELRIE